jgi:hypothetical protein
VNQTFKRIGLLCLASMPAFSSQAQAFTDEKRVFMGYEALEMSMNRFRNFAGQLAYRLDSRHRARLSVMEVKLTERHLSSKWEAAAVDGNNVEGYLRGYEAHLDRFFSKNWYVSGSVGYYEDTYQHTLSEALLENRTPTVGAGVGFLKRDLFGVKGLSLDASLPVRYYFNRIEKTKLGDATIRPHVVVNNLWLFVGLEF